MNKMNRRQFVVAAGAVVCAGVAGCASQGGAPWTGPTTFDVGPATALKAGIDSRWVKSGGFFLVREAQRVYAVSATCTHQACPLAASGDDEYRCNCHGSRFTPQGKVVVGPATMPLPRFGISVGPGGQVIVDRTRVFEQPRWDEAGAFVTV